MASRKKKDDDLPLQAIQSSEDTLFKYEKPAGLKKTSRTKIKVILDNGSMDMDSVSMEGKDLASMGEKPPSKAPRRKKRTSSAELEEKSIAVSPDGGEMSAFSSVITSHLTSAGTAVVTPKKASRKKKIPSSDLIEEENSMSVGGGEATLSQEGKTLIKIRQADLVTALEPKENSAVSNSKGSLLREGKLSSKRKQSENPKDIAAVTILEPEEGTVAASSETTIQEEKGSSRRKQSTKSKESADDKKGPEKISIAVSSELETVPLEVDAVLSGRKRSAKAKENAITILETDSASISNSSVSFGAISTKVEPLASSEAGTHALIEDERPESLPKRRRQRMKAKEDATASTDSSALSEDKTPVKVHMKKSKSKEPLASPESDRTTAEMISSSSKKVAASKPGLKITSKIDKISTQEAHAESTLEYPSLHEVRSVENSIDKASLTDGMPIISAVDTHASSRRRQSEALQLPSGSSINSPLSTEIVSTPTNKGLTNLALILKDFASSISSESPAKKEKTAILKKASARQNLEGEENASSIAERLNKSIEVHAGQKYRMPKVEVNTFQILGGVNKTKDTSVSQKWAASNTEENTPSTKRKVNKDGNQKWAALKTVPFTRDNFPIRSGGAKDVTDNLAGHKQIMPRRNETAPIRTGRANQLKEFPAGGQKWAVPNGKENAPRTAGMANKIEEKPASQQWASWKKNSPLANHARESTSVRFQEASSSIRIGKSPRIERESNEGQYLANMDRASGMERKGRRQFSVRNIVANQASTSSYMQIYGTGFDTGDTVPTVFLFFDRRRFIFNVGEGLHRFCMEHRFKLSKIDHVFLTRVCSETTGGLPGLILTLAEMGETGLTAQTWGPSNLQELAKAMRTFIPSGWMDHTHCFRPEEDCRVLAVSDSSPPILLLEDELIKISAVLLHPANRSERSFQNTSESVMSEERKCDVSTVYICELSKVRGKFDPAKALAKGLKAGYKYGKLQRGESVMSDDGSTMVHPEDVLGPSNPGPIMFLVDCPSLSYIPSLTSSTSLQSYFPRTGKVVNCMVHISPTSVTSSKDYQCWMENFKETHHIMARQQTKVLGRPTLKSSARILSKLNLICPRLFPIVAPQSQISVDVMNQKEAAGERMLVAENLLKFHFRPLADLGPDTSDIPEAFDPVAAHKKWSRESPEVLKAREKVEQVFKNWSQVNTLMNSWGNAGSRDSQDLPACLQDVSREEMELVFLGTGSSQPSKYRNVTGIYVHLFKHGGILLDCGEGTYAQLKRRYGAKGADDVLMGLKCIWISHMHADHFSGLARILSARRQLLEIQSVREPILVIGPKKLKVFLDAYGEIEDLVMEFLDCSQTTFEVQSFASNKEEYAGVGGSSLTHRKGGLIRVPSEGGYVKSQMQYFWKQPGFHVRQGVDTAGRESLRRVLQSLGMKDLFSVPVVHCPHAFAVVLEAQGRQYNGSKAEPGWKLVFSGDTRPCRALIEAARGATILIHEATFDDGMLAEAVKKNHSMTKEAIEVGVSAEVYRIFLTHFSQRYPQVPVFDSSYSDRTCIAFDMMSVNLADLPLVPQLLPAFQLLFRDQLEADDDLVISA